MENVYIVMFGGGILGVSRSEDGADRIRDSYIKKMEERGMVVPHRGSFKVISWEVTA